MMYKVTSSGWDSQQARFPRNARPDGSFADISNGLRGLGEKVRRLCTSNPGAPRAECTGPPSLRATFLGPNDPVATRLPSP